MHRIKHVLLKARSSTGRSCMSEGSDSPCRVLFGISYLYMISYQLHQDWLSGNLRFLFGLAFGVKPSVALPLEKLQRSRKGTGWELQLGDLLRTRPDVRQIFRTWFLLCPESDSVGIFQIERSAMPLVELYFPCFQCHFPRFSLI